MAALDTARLARLWHDYGQKVVRYSWVTVINVILGQILLVFFYDVVDLRPVIANFTAVTLGTIPAYLLSRRWVWSQTGKNSFHREIVPFWSMALLGLVLSTIVVAVVTLKWDTTLAVQGSNLAAFGSLWVFKFIVLETMMWTHETDADHGVPSTP